MDNDQQYSHTYSAQQQEDWIDASTFSFQLQERIKDRIKAYIKEEDYNKIDNLNDLVKAFSQDVEYFIYTCLLGQEVPISDSHSIPSLNKLSQTIQDLGINKRTDFTSILPQRMLTECIILAVLTQIENLPLPIKKSLLNVRFLAFAVRVLQELQPFIKIRFGVFRYERIGHLVHNTDVYLRRLALHPLPPNEFHFFVAGECVNKAMYRIIQRHILTINSEFLCNLFAAIQPQTRNSPVWLQIPTELYDDKLFREVPPVYHFSQDEEENGDALLHDMGLSPDEPFVCFHSRESHYLKDHYLQKDKDFSYHDYRDSSIENYMKAAQNLAESGLFALRVGAGIGEELQTHHPRIIDYATRHRSEFGDIYLLGKCRFLIDGNTGLAATAQAFNRPVVFVNWIPFGIFPIGVLNILIPKKIWSVEDKRLLSFGEIIAMGLDRCDRVIEEFKKGTIELIENTPEEIWDITHEMKMRIDGKWEETDEEKELKQRLERCIPPDHPSYSMTKMVGVEFLKQNQELL